MERLVLEQLVDDIQLANVSILRHRGTGDFDGDGVLDFVSRQKTAGVAGRVRRAGDLLWDVGVSQSFAFTVPFGGNIAVAYGTSARVEGNMIPYSFPVVETITSDAILPDAVTSYRSVSPVSTTSISYGAVRGMRRTGGAWASSG